MVLYLHVYKAGRQIGDPVRYTTQTVNKQKTQTERTCCYAWHCTDAWRWQRWVQKKAAKEPVLLHSIYYSVGVAFTGPGLKLISHSSPWPSTCSLDPISKDSQHQQYIIVTMSVELLFTQQKTPQWNFPKHLSVHTLAWTQSLTVCWDTLRLSVTMHAYWNKKSTKHLRLVLPLLHILTKLCITTVWPLSFTISFDGFLCPQPVYQAYWVGLVSSLSSSQNSTAMFMCAWLETFAKS